MPTVTGWKIVAPFPNMLAFAEREGYVPTRSGVGGIGPHQENARGVGELHLKRGAGLPREMQTQMASRL